MIYIRKLCDQCKRDTVHYGYTEPDLCIVCNKEVVKGTAYAMAKGLDWIYNDKRDDHASPNRN